MLRDALHGLGKRLHDAVIPARTAILTVAGLGLLSACFFTLAIPAGLAAAGVSCLVLELLSEGKKR